ncbi:MAG: molybdopterin-dependent oxidoreductase [Jhaorihella sp.]
MLPVPDQHIVATHWGLYQPRREGGQVVGLDPLALDRDPVPLADGIVAAHSAPARIRRPAIRRGFLAAREAGRTDAGSGSGRGHEPFVELPWDEALDLAAAELERVRRTHGNGAIYGGSYGWSSAGRFHHAQSQIHRFLNSIGGYTASVQNYSFAAADTILPHVVGDKKGLVDGHTPWDRILEHAEIIVMFGGTPVRNAQVGSGGVCEHILPEAMRTAARRRLRLVSISPIRDDTNSEGVEWLPIRPGTDTALILAVMHVLLDEGLADWSFLDRYSVGADRLAAYVAGDNDGLPKSPSWAAEICGIPADVIETLARSMARSRTFLMMSWSLQRAEYGEQPYWALIALASMIGQIGLPGGGYGFGYACANGVGKAVPPMKWPSLPQGQNAISDFIPVARIADALLGPGTAYQFNGEDRVYPDLRLIYWAGGNPFHHHQDINRLRQAWRRPETVIVHESWWTATARHADIVLPATTTLERNDIAASARDRFISASHATLPAPEGARDDYAIFSALAERLGALDGFTEGRDVEAWLRHLYGQARQQAASLDVTLPDFEEFWTQGIAMLPAVPPERQRDHMADFRADPDGCPLGTPSGRIELFSETIDRFGYEDFPGHPVWIPPREWLGAPLAARYPLHLVSNQPKHKLHSQYDLAESAGRNKRDEREIMRMAPDDAGSRGLVEGDIVRVFNDRGACLASLSISDDLLPGVVQLPTGAWYDPASDDSARPLELHGNPNVLTADIGTSRLAQGPSAHSCLVEVERLDGPHPQVRAFDPPHFVAQP